jgi:peptidoglycan/LPS O-acetylase OafA/YrhL
MLGVFYSRTPRNYSLKISIAIVLVGFLLEFIETYFLNTQYSGGVGIKLSAFIYSFGIVLFILHPKVEASYKENTLSSLIVYVGKISFGIYLIHCYMITVVDKLTTIDIWFLRWIIVSLITIIVIAIVRKFFPRNICKYIGFS